MPVNITTDAETDRMLSLRASSRIPLPPEISLCDAKDAIRYFEWLSFYELMGVSEHPFVKALGKRRLDTAMASAVSHADHLDRVSHYAAWLGTADPVSVVVLDNDIFGIDAEEETTVQRTDEQNDDTSERISEQDL